MYRIIPRKFVFLAFGWMVIGLVAAIQSARELFAASLDLSTIPGIAWLLLNTILLNPVWRCLWKRFPRLNQWFPDLNGTWDVDLCSNWPRHEQLLNAAESAAKPFDMRHLDEKELAPMPPIRLSAKISQTWWKFEMVLTNPASTTPIRRSDTISVDPIARNGMLPSGICYFYKQVNATDTVSDDSEFYGAARLLYDYEKDELEGIFWTARMWRRAMNTAGTIKFSRANIAKETGHPDISKPKEA